MSLVKLVREAWMYWRLYCNRLDTCICTCTVKWFFRGNYILRKLLKFLFMDLIFAIIIEQWKHVVHDFNFFVNDREICEIHKNRTPQKKLLIHGIL